MVDASPDGPAINPFQRFPLADVLKARGAGTFDRGNRPRDRVWASELGKCPRAFWLGWHNPRPHDEDFSQHRGALGHAVEEMIARKLAPVLVEREVSFVNSHVSGRVDFIVRLEGPQSPQIPVELKSTYAFSKMMNAPSPSHVLQLRYYLSCMPEAPFGILLYLNLANYQDGSGRWDSLQVPHDDTAVKTEVEHLLAVKDLPEAPSCRDPSDCWDCDRAEERKDKSRGSG